MLSVSDYLTEGKTSSPAHLTESWDKINELYSKKLWHQLTTLLQSFVKDESFQKGTTLLELYANFITEFENKINPLSLVEILCPYVIRQFTDSKEALDFLEKIKEKTKGYEEANILCLTAMGSIHLLLKDFDNTKKIMEECEQMLDALPGVTTVHSRFYELSSNYHQIQFNHNEYYKDALRYLGCVELDSIPVTEQQERAFNLGLAGLIGDKVYNFGELLQHPILDSLKGTNKQWLIDLLFAFNSGNIEKMDALKGYWSAQPDLIANEMKLRQKIMLLCLMEITFARPANNRHIDFSEIASKTGIPIDEVEILAMKAMSLGLVQGTIDQVEEKVNMTWVQPRVLDKQQISKMKSKLEAWCLDVNSMEATVANKASDILT
ncbi:26S proteasome non-ATPase regulatory subunit 13-like [Clavelina lepadiformis]|uniref:26S proteasome non-ATPase regulatory subunit 13-like n=1 Tax=Clavelina lepadiformis TaxID=159417 RepID=UPI0040431C38